MPQEDEGPAQVFRKFQRHAHSSFYLGSHRAPTQRMLAASQLNGGTSFLLALLPCIRNMNSNKHNRPCITGRWGA